MITCTLWDTLSKDFIKFWNSLTNTDFVVIILTHARIREPQGIYPVTISNAWNGSRLILDQKHPEVLNFKKIYKQAEKEGTLSQRVSQCTEQTQYSEQERFFFKAEAKTIVDISKYKPTKVRYTLSTI